MILWIQKYERKFYFYSDNTTVHDELDMNYFVLKHGKIMFIYNILCFMKNLFPSLFYISSEFRRYGFISRVCLQTL